jgi:hypothetical protein
MKGVGGAEVVFDFCHHIVAVIAGSLIKNQFMERDRYCASPRLQGKCGKNTRSTHDNEHLVHLSNCQELMKDMSSVYRLQKRRDGEGALHWRGTGDWSLMSQDSTRGAEELLDCVGWMRLHRLWRMERDGSVEGIYREYEQAMRQNTIPEKHMLDKPLSVSTDYVPALISRPHR